MGPRCKPKVERGDEKRGRRGTVSGRYDVSLAFNIVIKSDVPEQAAAAYPETAGKSISKLNLRVLPKGRPQGMRVPKRLNVTRMKMISIREAFIKNRGRMDRLHFKQKPKF
ncbi:hypothetical protein ACOMHN_037916 [Nucella lapillus]